MPLVNATETDTHPTNVKVPQDGDQVDAITVSSGMTALASRTNHLHLHALQDDFAAGVSGAATNIYTIPSGDILRGTGTGSIRPSFLDVTGTIRNFSDPTFVSPSVLPFTGPWSFTGDNFRTGKLTPSGAGARSRVRRFRHSTSNSDITVAYDVHILPNNILADRTRTVRTTGTAPEDGEPLTIVRVHPSAMASFKENIVSETGTNLYQFDDGNCGFVDLVYDTDIADWYPVRWCQYNIVAGGFGVYAP